MSVRIVQLGTPRPRGEGLRIGTVRRPPRGVPKRQRRRWFDVWLPNVAPSPALLRDMVGGAISWRTFERRYLAELKKPDPARVLDMLTAMSHHVNFAIGCYCADEARCHRSILRRVLAERGAKVRKAR